MIIWCRPNNTFVKIKDFVIMFESQKMSFGPHQSTTYENGHKMTTSEEMLWCKPNDNLVKIINFVKVMECDKIHLATTRCSNRITTTKKPFWQVHRLSRANDFFVLSVTFTKLKILTTSSFGWHQSITSEAVLLWLFS